MVVKVSNRSKQDGHRKTQEISFQGNHRQEILFHLDQEDEVSEMFPQPEEADMSTELSSSNIADGLVEGLVDGEIVEVLLEKLQHELIQEKEKQIKLKEELQEVQAVVESQRDKFEQQKQKTVEFLQSIKWSERALQMFMNRVYFE